MCPLAARCLAFGWKKQSAMTSTQTFKALLLAGLLAAMPLSRTLADDAAPAAAALPVAFGGPFELVDHQGRLRRDSDFRGSFLLIAFGYTSCPDICPTNLTIMATALDQLGTRGERVQPIFVTVDPARDTPAVLGDYVGHFHPRLIGLTGSEAQVRAAAKAYRVHRSKVILDPAAPEDYLVNHSSLTFLMAPDGGFVTLFPHDTDADTMAKAIAKYLGD